MEWLDPLALARWQFGLTTVYHFLFVPITIGMALSVALFQTAWYRTDKVHYLQLTRFFGNLFLINFAMGVVTGIVQEFQFGMNWSDYSRFVGDIFGAPLAFEGLMAFFFEATFIGLWIFGWDKLPRGLHLATIWLTWVGSVLSAYFILAANAFMQNPVGFEMNEEKGRAELVDIVAVLANPIATNSFPHTILGSIMVSAAIIVSVAAWHLSRNQHFDTMRPALKFGLWALLGSGIMMFISGDSLGLAMVEAQPMKMAAAEALYTTSANASFSVFSIGTPDGSSEIWSVRVPGLLSFLSTHTFTGEVEGINNLQAAYTAAYGPGDYAPIMWVTYWSFRWMIGLGALAAFVAAVGLFLTRGNRNPGKWAWKAAIWSWPLPLLAMSVGWIFTEMGRQPWIVFGLLKTEDGVSPGVTGLEVLISLVAFTAIYGVLAVVEAKLFLQAAHKGPAPVEMMKVDGSDEEQPILVGTVY